MNMNLSRILLLFFTLTIATLANGYELNGSMSYEGDGNYSVSVENENGHDYDGEANDNGDGTFDIELQDDDDQSHSGNMTSNGDGTYDLDLQNDTTGGSASGTVILNN